MEKGYEDILGNPMEVCNHKRSRTLVLNTQYDNVLITAIWPRFYDHHCACCSLECTIRSQLKITILHVKFPSPSSVIFCHMLLIVILLLYLQSMYLLLWHLRVKKVKDHFFWGGGGESMLFLSIVSIKGLVQQVSNFFSSRLQSSFS